MPQKTFSNTAHNWKKEYADYLNSPFCPDEPVSSDQYVKKMTRLEALLDRDPDGLDESISPEIRELSKQLGV